MAEVSTYRKVAGRAEVLITKVILSGHGLSRDLAVNCATTCFNQGATPQGVALSLGGYIAVSLRVRPCLTPSTFLCQC